MAFHEDIKEILENKFPQFTFNVEFWTTDSRDIAPPFSVVQQFDIDPFWWHDSTGLGIGGVKSGSYISIVCDNNDVDYTIREQFSDCCFYLGVEYLSKNREQIKVSEYDAVIRTILDYINSVQEYRDKYVSGMLFSLANMDERNNPSTNYQKSCLAQFAILAYHGQLSMLNSIIEIAKQKGGSIENALYSMIDGVIEKYWNRMDIVSKVFLLKASNKTYDNLDFQL